MAIGFVYGAATDTLFNVDQHQPDVAHANGNIAAQHILPEKKHIAMITQLLFQGNKAYRLIIDFINAN